MLGLMQQESVSKSLPVSRLRSRCNRFAYRHVITPKKSLQPALQPTNAPVKQPHAADADHLLLAHSPIHHHSDQATTLRTEARPTAPSSRSR